MQVNQTDKFQPVVIMLENKTELELFRHLMNITVGQTFFKYCKEFGVDHVELQALKGKLYDSVDPLV